MRLVETNAKLSHTLNKLFAERLKCFGNLIEEVSLKDSKKRLIKFLLDMLDEHQTAGAKREELSLPFTREEIAQRIGMARETLVRQLYHLENSKFIAIKSHQIIILDKEGLKELL